jgi:uncharacterized membrane protein
MGNEVTKTIIVKGDVDTVYGLWADFENFPSFMENVKSVTKTGPRTSEWTVRGPLGVTVKWSAEMTRQEENKRIAWSSKDHDGTLTTSGQVTFNDLPQDATEVTVVFQYASPGGAAGKLAVDLLANPEAQIERDLRNFKAFVEGMSERTA